MSKKRFIIESERIGSTYSIHIFKDDEVIFEVSNWDSLSNMHKKECEDFVDYLNNITNENEQLKKLLECSREEANDYCEELMEKDEFIRLYKSQRDDTIKENEQLKQQLFEARKDYLIETADISNTPHLDEDIEELRQEIFGDDKSNKIFIQSYSIKPENGGNFNL